MDTKEYFSSLSEGFYKAYDVAKKARAVGFDPKEYVEILPAPDLASRVDGLIGIQGIAQLIRGKIKGQDRSKLAFEVAKEICSNPSFDSYDEIRRIEVAVRVGTAILTEGVLVAPTEGIRGINKYRNQDGTSYIAIVYAGPIRGAGGTAVALSVALADYARKMFNIDQYKPTQEEIERCIEEIELYHTRAARLQYKPSDDDIRTIVGKCPVCVDGVSTEEIDVGVHGNLNRMTMDGKQAPITNKVRGGVALVICEGIAQKAKKVLKETKSAGLDWEWLNNVIKVEVKKTGDRKEDAAVFLEELVAGRPILAYPGHVGGFRLRYGRSRFTGIAAKGFNPATMLILDSFIAVGTQLKVEFPGKGCVAAPVDSIEGPFVKLKSGDALRVNDTDTALKVKDEVAEIISLGDILVTYGDFRKSNTRLQPTSYVEEFWSLQLAQKDKNADMSHKNIDFESAYRISLENQIPIHPKFLFEFQAVTPEMLKKLATAILSQSKINENGSLFGIKSIELVFENDIKRSLELLNVTHRLVMGRIVLEKDYVQSLIASLGFAKGIKGELQLNNDIIERYSKANDTLGIVNLVAPFKIMKRSTYVGARIGRPEKARERLMKPAPHVLFPIGAYFSKDRNITQSYTISSKRFKSELNVEIAHYKCKNCKRTIDTGYCYDCGVHAVIERRCRTCMIETESETCPNCSSQTIAYDTRDIDLIKIVSNSMKRVTASRLPDVMKGVRGLTNKDMVAEPLEKGILRALNNVYIFKDGTARFDATDMPMTHFYPKEISVGVGKLKELGYEKDYLGKELNSEDQLVELRHQDVILNRRGADYLLKVSHFIDEMLKGLYNIEPFYNAYTVNDLLGSLVITLSPHTSCGVLNRIIGFSEARVGLAHPYTISARRRNCDGDEDTAMLLLDALINFSREFLPSSVGGSMDTPLILTLNVMPEEVDDEVHAIEIVKNYPINFYEKTYEYGSPADVELELVQSRLNTSSIFQDLHFTHDSSSESLSVSPKKSIYTQLKTMQEKVDAEFSLMDRIYAINKSDAARKVITSHFIPDLIGNLHSFSRQIFRCSSCNAKYRRVPLMGKCTRDGGRLLLTISKGGIEKYLTMATNLADRYNLDPYIRQRLSLIKDEIDNIFVGMPGTEGNGQFNLSKYI